MRFFLRCFLSEIKKCVAEATHRKMHSSHCCYTSFPHTIVRYAEKEHAFLPKVKTAHLDHVNNINLCLEYIITRNNNFVNILKRKTADRIIVGSFLNFISLNLCAIIAWPSIATAYGSFTPFSPGRIARSVTDLTMGDQTSAAWVLLCSMPAHWYYRRTGILKSFVDRINLLSAITRVMPIGR